MGILRLKSVLVSVLAGLAILISLNVSAKEGGEDHGDEGEKAAMNPGLILMEHILDKHEFHFADYKGHAISIPLPVILYSPERGFSMDKFLGDVDRVYKKLGRCVVAVRPGYLGG